MSCNIEIWKTKKLDNLKIPIAAFYRHSRKDFHPSQPSIVNAATMEVSIVNCGQGVMRGILIDGILSVTEFSGITDDGSGIFYSILRDALLESTGTLELRTVWEGQSDISELICVDGVVTENQIEIYTEVTASRCIRRRR